MRAGRLRHARNPVFGWCIRDAVGQEDRRGDLFPAKQRDGKIDAAAAPLVAIGGAQASDDGAEDITALLLNPVMGWPARRAHPEKPEAWATQADAVRPHQPVVPGPPLNGPWSPLVIQPP